MIHTDLQSTVSKVLRHKEKYLSMDDRSRSPNKKSKGKVPDIEKALVNWARNYQRQGGILTDTMIKQKAHFFSTTCGGSDGKQKVLTTSWFEMFKRKNNLTVSKSRKGSVDTVISNEEIVANPIGVVSPTPQLPTQQSSQETMKKESIEGADMNYKHSHSQSTTSPDTAPSLSASVRSPTSPLVSKNPYPLEEATLERFAPQDDKVNGVTQNKSTPDIKTTMQPPPLPKSSTISPVSSPTSPTQDEARRALELVMNFFQNQPTTMGLQAQDYITIGKLMEKLELAQNQAGSMTGRLSRIDEHQDSPRMNGDEASALNDNIGQVTVHPKYC